jgi:allophanate hydrolase
VSSADVGAAPRRAGVPANVFITRTDPGEVAAAVAAALGAGGPLAGTTVAVKDNIDVAGVPTTAGCPSFAYTPDASASAVARLTAAGAVVVGKTNLDQFATGLVGTRSPYGPVESPWAPGRIAGGSSSGSAAAVALGLADLAVGTDTAGSGRVPAALCGVVGIKPTRGWVPTTGVVPACASFDCTTIFAPTVARAATAINTMAGPDPADPMSRRRPPDGPHRPVKVLGVGDDAALAGCDGPTRRRLAAAIERARQRGFEIVEVDLGPYLDAGELLYGGGFVAERYAAVGAFFDGRPADADPTVASIIAEAGLIPAWRYAADRRHLAELSAVAAQIWTSVDAVLAPTTPFHPTFDAVAADPVGVNLALGRFTSGCNLLDWCAIAVPVEPGGAPGSADPASDRNLPFGVQLLGPAWSDEVLWQAAAELAGEPPLPGPDGLIHLAVAGAHLDGQPLNHQLTGRSATLVSRTATAPAYRMVAIDGPVPKPGLFRVGGQGNSHGAAIEVEVWSLDPCAFGSFVAEVPPPLAIGTVELADGSWVPGFVCEPRAVAGANDITRFGGWRAWLAARP